MASKKRWKPKGDVQRLSSRESGIIQVPCLLKGVLVTVHWSCGSGEDSKRPGLSPSPYLVGQGDVVSRLKRVISWVMIWCVGVMHYSTLTKSPDPPSNLCAI